MCSAGGCATRWAGHRRDRLHVVRAGDRFEQTGARQYTIDPRRREDYQRLAEALDAAAMPAAVRTSVACRCGGRRLGGRRRGRSAPRLPQHHLVDAGAARAARVDAGEPLFVKIVTREMADITGAGACARNWRRCSALAG